jgi:hypothetical protein
MPTVLPNIVFLCGPSAAVDRVGSAYCMHVVHHISLSTDCSDDTNFDGQPEARSRLLPAHFDILCGAADTLTGEHPVLSGFTGLCIRADDPVQGCRAANAASENDQRGGSRKGGLRATSRNIKIACVVLWAALDGAGQCGLGRQMCELLTIRIDTLPPSMCNQYI